eukprot:6292834-Pyramimonas_sp.AAC.1
MSAMISMIGEEDPQSAVRLSWEKCRSGRQRVNTHKIKYTVCSVEDCAALPATAQPRIECGAIKSH